MADRQTTVLHLASWYPNRQNHVDGIFIRRQVELIASDTSYHHVLLKKSTKEISLFKHLLCLAGYFSKEKQNALTIIELPQQSFLYRKFFWKFRERIENRLLKKLVKKYSPSLVHLHVVYGFAREALFIHKQYHIPFIVSEHMGPFPFDWLPNKEMNVIQPMQQASKVVAVSEALKKQVFDFTGVEATVIPNVVLEKDFFYSGASVETYDGLPAIAFTGIYTRAKGADYLVESFALFKEHFPNAVLHLVGEATDERLAELKNFVRQKNVEQSVRFHGKLLPGQVCDLYNCCHFYACASEWESFGLSVLEALFTGLPVLTTNCGGAPAFIHPDNGMVVENNKQPHTFKDGLLQMAAHLNKYNKAAIANSIRQKFSSQKVKDAYVNLYGQVINDTHSDKPLSR
ncbi:MAG: glycosyltransferase [Bacteroidetes bacterium]|nr:glycosyltransferase [Bacteroidota bacterium]